MKLGRFTVLLIAVGLSASAGCQQGPSVSGTVTYNGQPVEKGSVKFASADGSGPGFGATIVDGKYTAEKVKLGPHIAQIRGLTDPPPMTREEFLKARQSANRYNLPINYIPEDAEGNNQSVEIKDGSQTLDFAVTGPPRPS
jgi:hypothetical protein